MKLSDIESTTGITMDEIISYIRYDDVVTAWISGSLVEGIGNPSSDVDVFVVVNYLDDSYEYVRKEEDYYVNVYFSNSRRIDYEYWPFKRVEELAKKLRDAPISDATKNVLDYFPEAEVEFIHRINIGLPFSNEDGFMQLKSLFDTHRLSQYLIENKRIYIDDAFDDTVGMLENGDLRSAAFRARYTLESSMDLLLFSYNITNHKEKHRIVNINKVLNNNPEVSHAYEKYWMLSTGMPRSDNELGQYIENALAFSESIVDDVELRWADSYVQ